MSSDQDSKQFDPSQKKLSDAQEKGQLIRSKEMDNLCMIGCICLFSILLGADTMMQVWELLKHTFQQATTVLFDLNMGSTLYIYFKDIIFAFLSILFLFVGWFGVILVLGRFIQDQPNLSFDAIEPKLSHISMQKGIDRLFNKRSLIDAFKSLCKITLIGGILAYIIGRQFIHLPNLIRINPMELPKLLQENMVHLAVMALAFFTIVGVLDLLYERYSYYQERRMSLQDLKDEHKEAEGNPEIRKHQRSRRQSVQTTIALGGLAEAKVVITNPTHIAVALAYKDDMQAPRVITKGKGLVALNIIQKAKAYNIALVQDRPTARLLYRYVPVGSFIPANMYETIAKIIAYVLRQEAKRS